MPITWIPADSNSYWKNGVLIGNGECDDEINCIVYKGSFNDKGKLEGANCEITNYSNSSKVVVKKGVFTNGTENGTVDEFEFDKSLWVDYKVDNKPIKVTKTTKDYRSGIVSRTRALVNNVTLTFR